jgi:transcriptional regulator with XRE-family HTH domain
MVEAGKALQETLKLYDISQSRLAKELGVERPVVFRWFHGRTDPTADTVVQIAQALRAINASAATSFINLYLGKVIADLPQEAGVSQLLGSEIVNINALLQVFDRPSDSYKYLLFLSLLDILEQKNFDVSSPICFDELVREILINAWIVHVFFKLSLGNKDRIANQLQCLSTENNQFLLARPNIDKSQLRLIFKNANYEPLIRYTSQEGIYHFIYPFFEQEIKALKGTDINQAILHLASNQFNCTKSLYLFNSEKVKDCTAIMITPDWASYLKNNFMIVKGWTSWQWLQYMQIQNPTTLNLVNKLFIPPSRNPLDFQTKFWESVMKHHPLRCLYSGALLNSKTLSLDYYLPWPFVAHDHLWNLMPISDDINSARSNHIPSDRYLRKFVNLQHLALTTNHQHLPKTTWHKAIAPYLNGLNLNHDDLLDHEKLRNAYEVTFHSLKGLALRQGFRDGWMYSA